MLFHFLIIIFQYFLLNFAIHHLTLRVEKWTKSWKMRRKEKEMKMNEWRKNNEHVERINVRNQREKVWCWILFRSSVFRFAVDQESINLRRCPATLAQSSLYSNGSGGSGSASSSTFGPIAATFHLKAISWNYQRLMPFEKWRTNFHENWDEFRELLNRKYRILTGSDFEVKGPTCDNPFS